MLGSIVTVTVDRPLGSRHPKHLDLYYPINYGYIEGIIAPDGAEQDAYILGVDEPVEEFTGKIIAIVHRRDDVEEKWVVAPEACPSPRKKFGRVSNFRSNILTAKLLCSILWGNLIRGYPFLVIAGMISYDKNGRRRMICVTLSSLKWNRLQSGSISDCV